jgi:glutathione S-transferase
VPDKEIPPLSKFRWSTNQGVREKTAAGFRSRITVARLSYALATWLSERKRFVCAITIVAALRRAVFSLWRGGGQWHKRKRMRTLLHFPISPASRTVRLVLGEKRLPFEPVIERAWEQRPELFAINPAGDVPVLIEDNGLIVPSAPVICEYLEEAYADTPLLGRTLAERVEVRRVAAWFDTLFAREVSGRFIDERVMKRLSGRGNPDGGALRDAYASMRPLMRYANELAENRNWLGGGFLSLADFTAAAHLSCMDFIGDIDWARVPALRDWYARMKSRPCFRPLLADRISGITPPEYYTNLDF